MYYIFLFFMTLIYSAQAQQIGVRYRSSLSGIRPNRYYDADARRMSITITVPHQPSESIQSLPDIADIPYAFPHSSCETPLSPTSMIFASAVVLNKNSPTTPVTLQKISPKKTVQKQSPPCCTIM